jgi:hypothetical protein
VMTVSRLSAIVGAGWICSRPFIRLGVRGQPLDFPWVSTGLTLRPQTRGGRRTMLPPTRLPGPSTSRVTHRPAQFTDQTAKPPPCTVAPIRAWWQHQCAGWKPPAGRQLCPTTRRRPFPVVPGGDRAIRHPAAGHPTRDPESHRSHAAGRCRARPCPRGVSGAPPQRGDGGSGWCRPLPVHDTWTAKGSPSRAFSLA